MMTESHSDPAGYETLETFSKAASINQWLYDKIKVFTSGQILEIGSGIGNISTHLLRENTTVSLSDLRPEYCALLEEKFRDQEQLQKVYELDLASKDFEIKYAGILRSFDTVLALNVVEHIENDTLAIQNAKSLLRANGKLVVLVPAGQWLFNSLDIELGHFKRYSKIGIRNLMLSAGLKVDYCRYFNAAAILGWWLSGNILHEKVIPPAKLNVYNRLVPVFRIADLFITPFVGVSIISVGVKI
jgi:2-polyprenyl-3-methyl-5-hydroxy-6-metoxy-1,4-benzoquinol methylase